MRHNWLGLAFKWFGTAITSIFNGVYCLAVWIWFLPIRVVKGDNK